MKIHLQETGTWTGAIFELKIDYPAIYFRGSKYCSECLPSEFTAREGTEARLRAALALLDVINWKSDYRPEDVGSVIDDGGSWLFDCQVAEFCISTTGTNAYPSFESPVATSLFEDRFGLLRAAVFSILKSSVPLSFPVKIQVEQIAVADRHQHHCLPTTTPQSPGG